MQLESWEIDRLTVAEVCADEVMTILDRHDVPRESDLFRAAQLLSTQLCSLLEPKWDFTDQDREHAIIRKARVKAAVKFLTAQLPPNGPELI